MGEKVFISNEIFTEDKDGMTLLANRCKSCGKVYFPKLKFCANCFSIDLEEIPLSRRGKLLTYTTTYMPSPHFKAPYANGYIDLKEGARIYAPLVIMENKPFKSGMEMELIIDTLWTVGDKEFVGFKFSPV